ncbi:MAG: carboxypeptidase regulatory-like domain-containing protein, partial [Acidobacteriota bacterium]
MRFPSSPYVLAALCVALINTPLGAQQPTGSITGVVTDPTGGVIHGASVTVTSQATRVTIELTTSVAGVYRASGLLPGAYEVRVEATGFKTAVVHLKVEVGRVTPADVRLQVGTVAETVTVEAYAVAVNPTQTTLEGVVTGNLIRDLPLNGRNFLDLGQVEPGVQLIDQSTLTPTKGAFTALSLASLEGQATRVTVDGLDISDEVVGSTTLNLSQDAIQEFQISRSTLDASTGLSGAGTINIVTKSGGNEIHGDAFFFLRTDDGAARVGQERVPFDREQVGFSVGGPFIRDRLFWFLNYERNNQDGAIATAIGGFPQFTGVWSVPFDEEMATGRLDWNIRQDIRAFFRFLYDDSNGVATGRFGLGGNQLTPFTSSNRANQAAAGMDATAGRLTHSFRYGHLDYESSTEDAGGQIPNLPRTVDPAGRLLSVAFAPFGCFNIIDCPPQIGTSPLSPLRILQVNDEFRYDGSISFGRHTLRWGALANRIRMNWFASFLGAGPEIDISFNPANQAICGNDVLCYPVSLAILGNGLGFLTETPSLGFPFGGAENDRFHWYVADSWRAMPRLTVNFAVRYVYEPGQNHPDLVKPALLDDFLPGLSRRDRRDRNNFAPQLGLAWDPTGSGKWVVRAGAGIFYETNFFNSSLFARSEFLPPGISWQFAFPPLLPVIDPVTGRVIFDMSGANPTALITPGVNWISGCSDPRFPGGECPLGTPGLIDAVFAAREAFKAASQAAAANFPSGPTQFEIVRGTGFVNLPNYTTPYSVQMNVGVQRELRPGLVLSADYVRQRGLHFPQALDLNRVGAADTLNVANALAAMNALHTSLGCPPGAAGVNCAIAAGASIDAYAAVGLGKGQAASQFGPSFFAFAGLNPEFNSMQFIGTQGQSTYDALQVTLRGKLPDLADYIRDWTVTASYSLSRHEGSADRREFGGFDPVVSNDGVRDFFGPIPFDRTHTFSFASLFEVPGGVRLSSIWRANSAMPQSVFVPQVSGSPAEIFFTDFNGDGT